MEGKAATKGAYCASGFCAAAGLSPETRVTPVTEGEKNLVKSGTNTAGD